MRLFRALSIAVLAAGVAAAQKIPLAELKDKIAGGWAGQMIGVSYGAPTEFRAKRPHQREARFPSGRPSASPTRSTRTIFTWT